MKMRNRNLHQLLTAALMLAVIFMVSCSEKNEETAEPVKPVVPIDEGDWQSVPAKGGTIEKGNIAITFPSGTFTSDTKVAISEVKKGQMCGDYELSPFYQVSLPAKCACAVTVTVKSDAKSSNPRFMAFTEGLRKSALEESRHGLSLDATAADGGYTVTLPATKNDDDDNNNTVVLGLVDYPDEGSAKSRVNANAIEGKVGNIEWYFDYNSWDDLWMSASEKTKRNELKAKINTYIPLAIKQIHDLGFAIKTNRQIPFVFVKDSSHPDAYGFFVQDSRYDEWSTIELNLVKLLDNVDETSLKQTVIHELLHYYQADYDPRGPFKKKVQQGEENILCEAGSVWAESFMDNGRMNGNFLKDYLPLYLISVKDLDAAYAAEGAVKKNKFIMYQRHGYGMSTLLYYLTSPISEMDAFDIDKKKIVDIYKKWDKNARQSFTPLKQWLQEHDTGFPNTEDFDKYIVSLLSGTLIKHPKINAAELAYPEGPHWNKATINKDGKHSFDATCYTLGCSSIKLIVGGYTNSKGEKSFAGKELVVKQTKPDLNTYIIAQGTNKDKDLLFKEIKGKTMQGDSLVVAGEELDGLFGKGMLTYLHVVTVNHQSSKQASNVTVEIRDQEMQLKMTAINELRLSAEVTIKDADTGKETRLPFVFSSFDNYKLTQQGTTVHLEFNYLSDDVKEKNGYKQGYYTERKLEFDIVGFTELTGWLKNCKVKNMIYSSTHEGYYGDGMVTYTKEYIDMKVSNMDAQPDDSPNWFTFGGETNRYTLDQFSYKKLSKDWNKPESQSNYTYVDDRENIIAVKINFEYKQGEKTASSKLGFE